MGYSAVQETVSSRKLSRERIWEVLFGWLNPAAWTCPEHIPVKYQHPDYVTVDCVRCRRCKCVMRLTI